MSVEAILNQLETTPGALTENWCVPRETGRFLHLMARLTRAKRICEVGTSIGYSTLWLASAIQPEGGTVDTIDYYESRQSQAKTNVEAAGLTSSVRFHQGAAIEILEAFKAEGRQFDLAFVDAAKKEYITYAQLLVAMMPSGAVLIADNTRSHRAEMQDFLDWMEASPDFVIADLETPGGQLVALKR